MLTPDPVQGHVEVAKLLVKKGSRWQEEDTGQRTLLHWAALSTQVGRGDVEGGGGGGGRRGVERRGRESESVECGGVCVCGWCGGLEP